MKLPVPHMASAVPRGAIREHWNVPNASERRTTPRPPNPSWTNWSMTYKSPSPSWLMDIPTSRNMTRHGEGSPCRPPWRHLANIGMFQQMFLSGGFCARSRFPRVPEEWTTGWMPPRSHIGRRPNCGGWARAHTARHQSPRPSCAIQLQCVEVALVEGDGNPT